MSFSLRLNFDGLLHFVVNDDVAKRDVRLCVLLPKALGHDARISALNGTKLEGSPGGEVPIDGQRVVLQFSRGSSPTPVPFEFEKQVMTGVDKIGAVPLGNILQESADKYARIVSADPQETVVRSQVLIGEGGSFILGGTNDPPILELPKLNGGASTSVNIAEELFMEVTEVVWARVLLFPLRNILQVEKYCPITPNDANEAVVTLSHTCVQANTVRIGDEDKDFRYQYLMLERLPRPIEQIPVPIIKKFSDAIDNFRGGTLDPREAIKPNGCNCAGTRGLARIFDNELDKFMTVPTQALGGR